MSGLRSALYIGTVVHARRDPTAHVFSYPVYMTLLALDELPRLDRELSLFGWNRRGVTSFRDRDHLDVRGYLEGEGVELTGDERIEVLTNLRVLGYVFNPVSFWWCRRPDGEVKAIVSEVTNTFGERLPYLLLPAGESNLPRERRRTWTTDKRLHVSPFMPMDQSYTWWFSDAPSRIDVRMAVHHPGDRDFIATLKTRRVELTPASLRAALVRYPLMPLRVTAGIHWQAARLALKRAPFYRKPPFVPSKGSVRQ